ncbi:MAG: hypothetical protein WDA16_02975 [Candidatus Thermoplasmatota archaeon]
MAKRSRFLPPWPLVGGHEASSDPAPAQVARAPTPSIEHHWLLVMVARPGPHEPLPVAGARVLVRPYPPGATRPGDVVARGTTGADGNVSLLLPAGRYALAARHAEEGKYVTLTLEHAGRAVLLLETMGKRVTITIETSSIDGRPSSNVAVEARTLPGGTIAARGVTDDEGVVNLSVPPGAYEVDTGGTVTKTYVETDTLLRLTAMPGNAAPQPEPEERSRYQQKVRQATNYVAPYDVASVREDMYN